MFHTKMLWVVAAFLIIPSEQRSYPGCRRHVCVLEMIIMPKESYTFYSHHVDPNLCSHIHLFTLGLNGNKLNTKQWHDTGLAKIYEELKKLKLAKPRLKILLTVGDPAQSSKQYSEMATTGTGRTEFINFLIPFLRDLGFDGVDLNWYFPTYLGGKPSDKETFADLIKEMATAFDKEALSGDRKRLILSAWGPSRSRIIDNGFNVTAFARYVDFINVRTYGYNGYKDKRLGHIAPLDSSDGSNIKETIEYWVQKGMPKSKINIVFNAVGRRVYTKSSSDMKIGESIITGYAQTANGVRDIGCLAQNEICLLLKQGGKVHWDSSAHSSYHVQDNYFLSYENEESIKDKVQYVRENEYGGVTFRSILEDDFLGVACGKGPYPLLRALQKACTVKMYSLNEMD